jgi:hypothetical protein
MERNGKAGAGMDPKVLHALGFGPDSLLMNDPKLFLDGRFLASVLPEFETELGADGARMALFQIGLAHGHRDALRWVEETFEADEPASVPANGIGATALVMRFSVPEDAPSEPGIELLGSWPETHEAEARLRNMGAASAPSCLLSAGYTSGWLSGTRGADILAVETECIAAGGERCAFHAREADAWVTDAETDRPIGMLASTLASLRQATAGQPPDASTDDTADTVTEQIDPNDEAVHIWGPVMVLPFVKVEESICTVEMLSRDPNTSSVRAVVIDLRGQPLDDGFAAAGLERVLDAIESWDAEVILTGVSPLAAPIVSELETLHLLMRKDLPEAIAAAFQIAEAQRHIL